MLFPHMPMIPVASKGRKVQETSVSAGGLGVSPRSKNPPLRIGERDIGGEVKGFGGKAPNLRWPLLSAAILAGLVTLVLTACGATSTATDWTFGKSLAVRVKEIRLTEEVRYSFEGKHYVVKPSQADRTLAAAYVELRTREANVVYLSVNKDTIRLRDEKYLDYRSTDPFQERAEVADTAPREDALVPFIWGDVSLPKQCGNTPYCELKGWVLFEVPRDIKFYQLIWDTGDTIYLYF